jgi:cell division protein ZipA
MDQLRLILLIVGVLLIAGIFVWELVKKRAAQRRRAQLVEHLAAEERSSLIGESVLGDIGQADPFEIVQRAPDRRSADGADGPDGEGAPGEPAEALAAPELHLEDYDIDEDFPGQASEESTPIPAAPAMGASPADDGDGKRVDEGGEFATLSGLAARRDGPEQLDLAGLELSAPARGGEVASGRRANAANRRTAAAKRPRAAHKTHTAQSPEQLHVVMTVMARNGESFSGDALRHAFEHAELHHGDMNIFHRHEEPRDRRTPTLFSAANVLAPGHFEPADMDSLSTPGIAIFMRLPGPDSPADAFQQMLDTAKTVAEELQGTLCDETRSTLTAQSVNHLRERIADFGRRQMLKA